VRGSGARLRSLSRRCEGRAGPAVAGGRGTIPPVGVRPRRWRLPTRIPGGCCTSPPRVTEGERQTPVNPSRQKETAEHPVSGWGIRILFGAEKFPFSDLLNGSCCFCTPAARLDADKAGTPPAPSLCPSTRPGRGMAPLTPTALTQ